MHLKGGAKDALLYRLTMGMSVFGKADAGTFMPWYNFQCANNKILYFEYSLQCNMFLLEFSSVFPSGGCLEHAKCVLEENYFWTYYVIYLCLLKFRLANGFFPPL